MKFLSFLIFLILFIQSNAQTFSIEGSDYPYFNIIEWKGNGAMLMSKNPDNAVSQIHLTLVNQEKQSVWDREFNRKNEAYYFISSENARYVYFLHNLELINGKVYFAQLFSAGNPKASSVNLHKALDDLFDFDPNELELQDIVVTENALVHQFRYYDKKNDKYVDYATFMTHHNLRVYAAEIGFTHENYAKSEEGSFWRYCGFTGDEISFAASSTTGNKKSWTVKTFSSKGKPKTGVKLPRKKNAHPIEVGYFGTTGSSYLDKKAESQTGIISFIQGEYYLTSAAEIGEKYQVTLHKLVNNEWGKIMGKSTQSGAAKRDIAIGIYPLNEGVGLHVETKLEDEVWLLPFQIGGEVIKNPFSEKTMYNPSSMLLPDQKNSFVIKLPTGFIYFDKNQLPVKGSVNFEIKK